MVIQRPSPRPQTRISSNRFSDVVLRGANRVRQLAALRQECCDRGRKRAAGAMSVARLDAFAGKLNRSALAKQKVGWASAQMSSFYQDGARTHRSQCVGGATQAGNVAQLPSR